MFSDLGQVAGYGQPDGAASEACGDGRIAGCMTASEQMFFQGAPLAHVLLYEELLITDRRQRRDHLGHSRRLYA